MTKKLAPFLCLCVALVSSCRDSEPVIKWEEPSGIKFHYIGTPGKPRAVISDMGKAPHTILISEGKYFDQSASIGSDDFIIGYVAISDPEDRLEVRAPRGSVTVVTDDGNVERLSQKQISWDGEILKKGEEVGEFDHLITAVVETSKEQHERAERDTAE
jgi:hypothetical protein